MKMTYVAERASGAAWGDLEEMFTMMGGLAVFAVFCIAVLLWLV